MAIDVVRGTGPEAENYLARHKIHGRICELEKVRENYVGYLEFRIRESDWHGAWDASVNISETECEMSGLRFALNAIEGT